MNYNSIDLYKNLGPVFTGNGSAPTLEGNIFFMTDTIPDVSVSGKLEESVQEIKPAA